jgi:hypothetical protein
MLNDEKACKEDYFCDEATMKKFVARKDHIEGLLENLSPARVKRVEWTLDPEHLAEGKMDDQFCCPICIGVVIDPEECKLCEKPFCKKCIC